MERQAHPDDPVALAQLESRARKGSGDIPVQFFSASRSTIAAHFEGIYAQLTALEQRIARIEHQLPPTEHALKEWPLNKISPQWLPTDPAACAGARAPGVVSWRGSNSVQSSGCIRVRNSISNTSSYLASSQH